MKIVEREGENIRVIQKDDVEEKKIEDATIEQKDKKRKVRTKNNKKRSRLKRILLILMILFVIGAISILFLLYGPYSGFRNWLITTAMTTMNHQYLATWFYDDKTIDDVLSKNRVIEVSEDTNPDLVVIMENSQKINYENEYERTVLEKGYNNEDYKIVKIDEKSYSGYLAIVYHPENISTVVTKNIGKSGQYITDMAIENDAVLAINGGNFDDPNYSSTGGQPLGVTISNGKLVSETNYTLSGGVIGFNNENKLVLARMTGKEALAAGIRDSVSCGPFLIINGKSSEILGNGGWGKAPRTVIGQRKDGIVLFLVIDGRNGVKQGADMDDLIEIMERYGAYNAACLDGGTSSVMVENGNIINDPIDSTGAHRTRPIATGFILKKSEEN